MNNGKLFTRSRFRIIQTVKEDKFEKDALVRLSESEG